MRSIRWKFHGTVSIETDDAHYCVGATYARDGTLVDASILDIETNIGEVPESVPDWVTRLLSTPVAFEEARRKQDGERSVSICSVAFNRELTTTPSPGSTLVTNHAATQDFPREFRWGLGPRSSRPRDCYNITPLVPIYLCAESKHTLT